MARGEHRGRRPAGATARSRRVVLLLLLSMLGSCSWFRGTAIPIWHVMHTAPAEAAQRLFVLLPGIGDGGHAFVEHGFVDRIQSFDPTADVVTVDAHLGYYIRGLLAERLHQDIVRPRRERYREVWLVGISLGGLGAMNYAADYEHVVDGVVLLAPFLGDDDVIDAVRRAGGVRSWVAPELGRFEKPMQQRAHAAWSWARSVAERGDDAPPVHLGFGAGDPYAAGHALLAEALPADRVLVLDGAHDWTTWTSLFARISERALAQPGATSRAAPPARAPAR